jgi:hypothetical protein
MTNFKKPPLTSAEKEKKAENFINFVEEKKTPIEPMREKEPPILRKEAVKSVLLRMPESFKIDIQEIMIMTGLSFNSVCLELLRTSIKKKLK